MNSTIYRLLLITFFSMIFFSCEKKNRGYDMPDIQTPYRKVSGTFSGEQVPHSPDPLVAFRWEDPKHTDSLQVYTLTPLSVKVDKPENATIKSNTTMTINGPCDLMFDFGVVSAAWFEFDAGDIDGEIEMSISEFNEPAVFNLGSQHPWKTAVPVRHKNIWRLELNDGLYEGVRFAWIHIKSLNKPVDISGIRLVCQIKPTNYEGSFACSDTMLTRIWYTGAYTVKTNLLQDYFGAILMERSDRHSWTGDAHTSQAASMVAFGNFDFVKQNLRYTSTQYNGIASYSLYWILSLIDYYMYTGDKELLDEMLENACYKLDMAYEHYGDETNIVFYGWDERLGGGFENANIPETRNAYKMLSIQSWHTFSKVMRSAGYTNLAEKYEKYAEEKINLLRSAGDWSNNFGLHASADAINAAFASEEEQRRIAINAFSDRQQRLSYSPFNQYFIIQALAKAGWYNEALNTIDDCWGGQIRYGGTTFFEVFRPSWNDISSPNDAPVNNQCGYTSLTHPWSAGVTKWLSEEIVGIKPITPGFSSCTIKPRLTNGLTWVKGSVPTPHGKITVYADIRKGKYQVEIPPGATALVGIPKAGRQIKNIRFGKSFREKEKEDADFVYYNLPTGNYHVKVKYTGELSPKTSEKFSYPHKIPVKEDDSTQGNWRGKYGTEGYVLYNYERLEKNCRKLPEFVEDLHINRSGNIHWTPQTSDIRALESPLPGVTQRAIGAIITRDPQVCQQTFTMDIKTKQDYPYTVSLYFVDWDKKGRRTAIEAFDLESKEMLLPVYMVRDYEQGKYITYTFNQPVRLRIDHVRGENTTLSGIFFD
ncbi:alpha-L-rhamnosidase C-terminal domain-containing protein [Parabacteroides pacaensis]|uniref:alpha-L-rhamnosidase C-terminal domain-containing protein n=1 Tax=Parabacteroides pacaensis TaxID=2086575 RepID=UPI000D10C05F|nr:alpha-L-rhamnosidase C-terminal domain-containing protein [Parabacteroides pacaensis]